MILWGLAGINALMELLVIVVGLWVYEKKGSKPALLIAFSYLFFMLPRFTFMYPSFLIEYITLVLRIISYVCELLAVVLLLLDNKKR